MIDDVDLAALEHHLLSDEGQHISPPEPASTSFESEPGLFDHTPDLHDHGAGDAEERPPEAGPKPLTSKPIPKPDAREIDLGTFVVARSAMGTKVINDIELLSFFEFSI